VSKAGSYARTKESMTGSLIFQGVAEDIARLFLHAASMSSRAALKPGFHFIFQMTNHELSHVLTRYHDIVSTGGDQEKSSRIAPVRSLFGIHRGHARPALVPWRL
jgi:hypothetical protein